MTMPSRDEVRYLQELLMRAVITGQSLPGMNRPLRFPDLGFIMRQSAIYLSDENLGGPISLEGSPLPLRILSRESLVKEARARNQDIAYLAVSYRALDENMLQLTLEGRITPHDSKQPQLGLSSVHLVFRKVAGKWEVVGEPSFSAN
jgi:hypothetical protein